MIRRTPHTPQDRRLRRLQYGLVILSGLMLGFSFPPSPFGILACFGLVPLLIVLGSVKRFRTAMKFTYVAMLVFHVITLNWTGGYVHGNDPYMMIAGGMTMLLHPLFYMLPLGVYHLLRTRFSEKVGLVALPFLWVGYEFSHSLSEWSFPWLTIGNSQSYDLARIQFIDATGVYGLSFWIVIVNVIAFLLYQSLAGRTERRVPRTSYAWLGVLIVVFVLPEAHGMYMLSRASSPVDDAGTLTVGMIQSNVDPWDKWNTSGPAASALYFRLTDSLLASPSHPRPQIVLWPETAMPDYLLLPSNRHWLASVRSEVDRIRIPVLTGLPQATFYADPATAPPSAKTVRRTGERYDTFNSVALIEPGGEEIPWYGKMKMVPLAERIPYADMFAFLDFMRWGVGIGGWQIGPDTTIFTDHRSGARFASIICYESVYPGFVASFVRKGAQFMALITIDSWWDKMSGAYQHAQFAVFRAVENRRWIARCAVGGISCYIDPYGRAHDRTELFTRQVLSRTIGLSNEQTFYTRHGDWFGEVILFVAGLFWAAGLGQKFFSRKREGAWQSSNT
ncbi:MAG: apolipoprotein N-acyltransferase [Bacteroidota bacterium]